MKWNCKATQCPDRTGKLEKSCERCSTHVDRNIDCPLTYCEMFPKECNASSIHCLRCERYKNCYPEVK